MYTEMEKLSSFNDLFLLSKYIYFIMCSDSPKALLYYINRRKLPFCRYTCSCVCLQVLMCQCMKVDVCAFVSGLCMLVNLGQVF